MQFSKEILRAAKPVVAMQRARIVNTPDGTEKVLIGYPFNHPRERLNDKQIRTSAIVSIEGDTVETRNTVFVITSWDNDGN